MAVSAHGNTPGQSKSLIRKAELVGLLPPHCWDNGRFDAGRQLRNRTIHGESQQLWTPVMTESVIRASHEAVAALYPDEYRHPGVEGRRYRGRLCF